MAKKRIIVMIEIIVALLLIISLFSPAVNFKSNYTSTIFVVDVSDSMEKSKDVINDFLKRAVEEKSKADKFGVIAFGGNSTIDNFLTDKNSFKEITSEPNKMYTNIQEALNSAVSLFPSDSKKRIVLITDGEENEGNSLKEANEIIKNNIDFKVYKIKNPISKDVSIESIELPKNASEGQSFDVVVNIMSTVNTSAKLTLFNGDNEVSQKEIKVQTGENRFIFKDSQTIGGFKSYRVLIEANEDDESRNNEAYNYISIKKSPKVLVIEDRNGEAEQLAKIFKATGINSDLINADIAPKTLEELLNYNTIITCNVSAENLSDGFLKALESYVKNMGGGYVATGGDNSFALGGYFKTPLEKILPVNMELKGKKKIPDMTMMLVIDHSGSMSDGTGGIQKLEVAKEAALRSLDSLRNNDKIGVLAFDGGIDKVVKIQRVKNRSNIEDLIGSIRGGGGTSILPALREAFDEIKDSKTKIKHIILLTDGIAERDGYDELLSKLNKNKITLSTVAVGNDSDVALLGLLAESGKGRFYQTNQYENIPKIFAKETFMATKAYLNNRKFTPKLKAYNEILSGVIDNGTPNLYGYISSTIKPQATMLLASDKDDEPILSSWQYGLGRSVAWNSDVSGQWNRDFNVWGDNAKLWQNIVSWTAKGKESSKLEVNVEREGDKAKVRVKDLSNDYLKNTEMKCEVVSKSFDKKSVVLAPVSPNEYEGEFKINELGNYLINVTKAYGKKVKETSISGFSASYSPEYSLIDKVNRLNELVKSIKGKFISSPKEVYRGNIKGSRGSTEITEILLSLAFVLFLIGVFLKRISFRVPRVKTDVRKDVKVDEVDKEEGYTEVLLNKQRKKN